MTSSSLKSTTTEVIENLQSYQEKLQATANDLASGSKRRRVK